MKNWLTALLIALPLFLGIHLSGCTEDTLGEKVEEAGEEIGDEIDDATTD